MSKITKRITAMLLSGMLVIGSVHGSVFAASTDVDPGQISEIAEEVFDEESSDTPAGAGEPTQVEETSEAPAGTGETAQVEDTSEAPAAAGESYPEDVSAEVQYYTVTLDANGGYFENEWDDALSETVEKVEVVEKQIPVDGTVASFPVLVDQDGRTMVFAGWSLERDGELVSQADEEYIPVGNCVLYAVWQIEEATGGFKDTDEVPNSEEAEEAAEAGEVSDPEEAAETGEVSDPEEAAEAGEVSGAEEVEEAAETGEVPGSEEVSGSDILSEDGQGELFSDNFYNEYIAGDSCGENTRWELDDEGILTISGEGAVESDTWRYHNDDITAVIITEGVTSIPFMAFYNYINLESVSVPESLTSIGNDAFWIPSLKYIDVPNIYYWLDHSGDFNRADSGWNLYFSGQLVKELVIPEDVTDISFAFYDCESLRSVTIPDACHSIGYAAFSDCKNLGSVTISDSISEIGPEAFKNCSSLTQISFPDNLRSIGGEAFYGCTCLTRINIPDTLTRFGRKVFYGTPWSQESNGFIIKKGVLLHYDEISEDVVIPEEVTAIGDQVFQDCQDLKTVEFPDTLKSIGGAAFRRCSGLTEIEIPEGTELDNYAFEYCSGLQRVVLPDDLEFIPNYCFSNCISLTDINLPEHLRDISWWAFDSCTSLTEVTIPKSLDCISWRAFGNCTSLSKVIFEGGEYAIYSEAFIDNAENLTFYGYSDTPAQEYAEDYGISFIVKPRLLNDAVIHIIGGYWAGEEFVYTGNKICPKIEVRFEKSSYSWGEYMMGSRTLKAGEDYEAVFSNNINVGEALVTVTGKGAYTGSLKKTFKIIPADIQDVKITGIQNKTYTGKEIKQTATLKLGSVVLHEGRDYKVSYSDNINAGTAYVYFKGMGNFCQDDYRSFKIEKATQTITAKAAASSVAVGKTTVVSITGAKGTKSFKSSNTAIVTVTSAGKVTAKKVGTVKITATSAATSNYNASSKTVTIKVVPAATTSLTAANQATGIKLTWKKVTGANGYKVYRGSTLIKTITSVNTVTFADTKANTNGTKYTYKVVAKASTGDSTLSKSVSVYRVARPAVSSVTNSASKKMTVKWGKNAKATGYQIQYSLSSSFASGNKAVTVASASTVSKVIGSLTKGKTYYVRIRTYKTVGSAKYWSEWSSKKSVKISK